MVRVQHCVIWAGRFVPPGLIQRIIARVHGALQDPIVWHSGIVGVVQPMGGQTGTIVFRLIVEDRRVEGEVELRIGVSGSPENLEQGFIGQILLGAPIEGLPTGGVHAAMEILRQFKGSACNHCACHPAGGMPIEVATLEEQKRKKELVALTKGRKVAKEAPLAHLLPEVHVTTLIYASNPDSIA